MVENLREGASTFLYASGGVLVGQGVVAVAGHRSGGRGGHGRIRVERVQRLHAADGARDHGDGVGRHQWHVLGRPAQSQRVVGWADGGP